MRKITIHRPTHKFFAAPGEVAIAIGQLRGSTLYLNRFENGSLIEKTYAVESCAMHMTNYGKGVRIDDSSAIQTMRGAWRFVFGSDCAAPVFCELYKES